MTKTGKILLKIPLTSSRKMLHCWFVIAVGGSRLGESCKDIKTEETCRNPMKIRGLWRIKRLWRAWKKGQLFQEIAQTVKECAKRHPLGRVALDLPFYSPTGFPSDDILQELRSLNEFTYLPNGGNIGDIVIAMAEYQLFEKHKLKYEVIQERVRSENLVIGGGGGFVPYWDYGRKLKVIQENKHLKRIIILSSSFYDCPDFLEIVDERFTLFCRETKSRDYLLAAGVKGKVVLAHDMALLLTEDFQTVESRLYYRFKEIWQQIMAAIPRLTQQEGYTTAYFLRTDVESKTDWSKIGIQSTLDLSICAHSDCRCPSDAVFYGKLFFAGIDMADIVVTDRLHVGISSMLLGKEVFLLDNSYGKVSGVYEHSMRQCSRVHFVNDVQELPSLLERTIAEGQIRKTANKGNLEQIGATLTRK